MKKLLSMLLVLSMVLSMVVVAGAEAPVVELTGNHDEDSNTLYDYVLGDYLEAYEAALACMDVSERYALEAVC